MKARENEKYRMKERKNKGKRNREEETKREGLKDSLGDGLPLSNMV